ncbi:hypothetical protein M9H77_26378 [Catharanthus roseus]|uniref:Uncharacterized protein n=1 Tax=Catharanthus roseus TaxID=4058 RepID=A0ACC0AB13_CATRO|nr:hypothetical protein M9H77_26378 [Catharanthus roseus]
MVKIPTIFQIITSKNKSDSGILPSNTQSQLLGPNYNREKSHFRIEGQLMLNDGRGKEGKVREGSDDAEELQEPRGRETEEVLPISIDKYFNNIDEFFYSYQANKKKPCGIISKFCGTVFSYYKKLPSIVVVHILVMSIIDYLPRFCSEEWKSCVQCVLLSSIVSVTFEFILKVVKLLPLTHRKPSASEKDVFILYNDYAFRLSFGVHKGKQKFKAGSTTKHLKQFYCYKQGKNLMDNFGCHNENWLNKLYNLREKWYPAFSKDFFSRGVLLSQMSKHANGGYTIGVYKRFENQFMKFPEYCQGLVVSGNGEHIYEVWHPNITVLDIQGSRGVSDAKKVNKKDIAGSSVWKREMLRKFSDLISTSELNVNAREYVKEEFRTMKDKIIAGVDLIILMIQRMK